MEARTSTGEPQRPSPADPLGTPLGRAAFEASTECMIVLDPEGIVLAANRAFCDLYGVQAEAIVGDHYMGFSRDFEIRRFGDQLDYPNWVTAAALKGETVRGILQGVRNRRTGREFFGRYGATPVHEEGRFAATIITILDVTEATRAAQGLEAALSAAEVGTWRADVKDGLLWADRNYARVCGLPEEELRGIPLERVYALIHPEDRERALRTFREASEAGQPHEAEYRIVRPDGAVRWLVSRGMVALADSGEPRERVGSIVDITRRKESEQTLRATTDAVPALVSYVDTEMRYRFCNAAYEQFFGRLREAILGRTMAEVLGVEAFKAARPRMEAALAGEEVSFSMSMVYPDAGPRNVQVEYRPRRRPDGTVEGVYALVIDETERRTAERALRESEAALRSFFDHSPLLMGLVELPDDDSDIVHLYDSPATERLFGLSPGGTGGRGALELGVPPAVVAEWIGHYRSCQRKGSAERFEYDHPSPEGTVWLATSVSFVGLSESGRARFAYVTEDVTERRRSEEALRQGERQYRQIAEGLPQMVWTANPEGIRDYFNARWLEYTGVGLKEAENPWLAVLHPEDREWAWAAWRRSVERGETFQAEYRLRAKDGRYRWFLGKAIALRNEAGDVVRWFGTCTDIDEQKTAQSTLEITNRFAQTLVADLDLDRIVQVLTDATTQAVGAQFGSFFYNAENDEGEAYLLYTLSGAPKAAFENLGMPRPTAIFGPTFRAEGIVRSADIAKDPRYGTMAPHHGMPKGHLPVVSYLAVPVVSLSGEVVGGLFFGHREPGVFTEEHERIVCAFAAQAAVAMDNARLYERVRNLNDDLERQVRARTADLQASNEALRGFTYHVAHDLRAPLRSIVSTSRMVQEDFGEALPPEAHTLLNRQVDAAGKLGQLIDDLLKLSRLSRSEIQKERLDLSALAREAAEVALAAHGADSITIRVAAGLTAKADANLVGLALGNLIENAVKYSPGGGTIRIGQRKDGAFFVSDEGIGIDPQYFERVFEPFQRLHRDEEFAGTGIGLSNVRQVVERHGGRVWVESQPGQGSTFLFTLG